MNSSLKISIITPSLNQGEFIDDNIQSVLNQKYNNFEHIIIDGGSTDQTIKILKKYSHLKWISEKDEGQSNAINKGFKLASGNIIAWLNADDYYEENIFKDVSEYFYIHDDCQYLYGDITYVDKSRRVLTKVTGNYLSFGNLLKNPDLVRQPSTFWRKSILDIVGYLDEDLHLVMDLDFSLRIGKRFKYHYINKNFSYFRTYKENKTSSLIRKQLNEIILVLNRYGTIWKYRTLKFLLGRCIDSLNENNVLKNILNRLRKK